MATGGVDMIDTNSIGPQLCHQTGIEFALLLVDERVQIGKLVGNACYRISGKSIAESLGILLPLM